MLKVNYIAKFTGFKNNFNSRFAKEQSLLIFDRIIPLRNSNRSYIKENLNENC